MGAILLVASAIAGPLEHFTPVRAFENFLDDLRQAYLSPAQPQHPDIVLVVIDEQTLAPFPCRSPVDRGLLADLLADIARRRPLAIGLDLLLDRAAHPAQDARLRDVLAGLDPPVVLAAPAMPPTDPTHAAFLATMLEAAEPADASLLLDPVDGHVRAVRLRDQKGRLGFAAALARRASVRLPEAPELRISWRRGPGNGAPPFRSYPAHALPLLPDDWLAGRIVLVGAALDDSDRWPTPLSRLPGAPSMSGLEVHAQALAQLLDGQPGPEPSAAGALLPVPLAAASGMTLAALLARPGPLLLLAPAGAAAWLVIGFAGFALGFGLLPVASPFTAFIVALGLTIAAYRRSEWRRRREVEHAFAQYLAPAVVRRIAAHPARLERMAERRELTFLFTDLEGFTSVTEAVAPELVARFLEGYFDGVVEAIFAHEGMVDKLVGDAVHAFFGAPEPQPDDAARAVRCALDILRFTDSYRERWQERGVIFGRTRIGIHRGPALVGNFGSRRRFDYTAHGDAVNTAARLEQANKLFGTRALVSDAIVERCPEGVFRPVALLRLRGKRTPLAVFEPLDGRPEWLTDYLACYAALSSSADDALERLRALRRHLPDDPVVAFHLARLESGRRGELVSMEDG